MACSGGGSSCCKGLLQFRISSSSLLLKSAFTKGLTAPPLSHGCGGVFGNGSRQVHNWVRPVIYQLRGRRKVEYNRHPERAKPPKRSNFIEWNYRAELYAFGKRLGENFEESLLTQAFVDKSFVHEERKRQEELGLNPETVTLPRMDNTELVKRGEELLNKVLASFLQKEFPKLPNEGIKAVVERLTSDPILANISSLVGSKDLIQCNEHPPSESTFASTFKATVGALELSSGAERMETFVVDFVASHLCGKDIHDFWDIAKPWHMLLQLTKAEGKTMEPRLLRQAGTNTLLAVYVVGVYDENKKLMGTGIGETLDIAQEMAARDVLRSYFGTQCPIRPFTFQSSNYPVQLIPHVRNP